MATQTRPRWTFEDYFAWEALQPTRHEFVDGQVYSMVDEWELRDPVTGMSGGTARHDGATLRCGSALYQALRGKPCEAHLGNLKLKVEASGNSYYPDAYVTCDPAAVEERGLATDATVIVEVLSPSTAAYDRGAKFADYRRLPSLAHYVLIDANAQTVECHRRDDTGWRLGERQTSGILDLPAIGVTLAIADLFEGLGDPLPPVDGPPPGRVDPHAA